MTGHREGDPFVLIHADESCLGNQHAGPQPGGAGAIVESRRRNGQVERWDWYAASPATTNNRMALHGAIAVLERLLRRSTELDIHFFSDSRYLVDGITKWVPNWKARGWTRKGGAVENLEMWKRLDALVRKGRVSFHWVRGHHGHPKNEYVDYLAVRAARNQTSSDGLMPSDLTDWLQEHHGRYNSHDPDRHFNDLAARYTR